MVLTLKALIFTIHKQNDCVTVIQKALLSLRSTVDFLSSTFILFRDLFDFFCTSIE